MAVNLKPVLAEEVGIRMTLFALSNNNVPLAMWQSV